MARSGVSIESGYLVPRCQLIPLLSGGVARLPEFAVAPLGWSQRPWCELLVPVAEVRGPCSGGQPLGARWSSQPRWTQPLRLLPRRRPPVGAALRSTILLTLCLVAACKDKSSPVPAPPLASQAAAASVAPVASTPAAPTASASAKPSGSAQPSEAEVEALRAYGQALGRGRKLTIQKKYDDAVAAFDKALRALPGDPRALSERGFARLQGGDLDGAEGDFYDAIAREPEAKILSAATYNLALVADKRGNTGLADELKEAARSHRAPANKRSDCGVQIGRGKQTATWESKTRAFTTLREVRTAMNTIAADRKEPLSPPLPTVDEEEILEHAILGDKTSPWVLPIGDSYSFLAGQRGDYKMAQNAFTPRFGRCGSTHRSRVEARPYPHVVTSYYDSGYGLVCGKGTWEPEDTDQHCLTGCTGPSWSEDTIVVFDPTTLDPLVSVTVSFRYSKDFDESQTKSASFTIKDDRIHVLGASCAQVVSIRP